MHHAERRDEDWMRVALGLARRGLGNVAPNPAVGCIIVKDGVVVGRGWTQPGGRPHAETEALAMAGTGAAGATAFVSLEPCAHTGQTGPCAEALVAAGVARVVVGACDPDPRVAGRGISILEKAGVDVASGILETECETLNRGFLSRVSSGRPTFTLKSATSIDGKIALASGESKWITGPRARTFGHMLRARHDAILVGVGTILADDPALTCRIDGLQAFSPRPIILDSDLRTPVSAKVLQAGNAIIMTRKGNDAASHRAAGATVLELGESVSPSAVSAALADADINSVLIEGGARVSASFLAENLIDEIYHFSAGKLIGSDGLGAVGELGLASLDSAPHFMLKSFRRIGPDMLATYMKSE